MQIDDPIVEYVPGAQSVVEGAIVGEPGDGMGAIEGESVGDEGPNVQIEADAVEIVPD